MERQVRPVRQRGFAGTIPSGYLKRIATQGYATAGADDGHQDPVGTSATWALGHPEKLTDYGWRALKETTDIAKALIRAQTSRGPELSYFTGCSGGGRPPQSFSAWAASIGST